MERKITDCNFLGSSKSYDDHLVEYHDLPKAQERTKAEKSQTKKHFISVVNVMQNIQLEFL